MNVIQCEKFDKMYKDIYRIIEIENFSVVKCVITLCVYGLNFYALFIFNVDKYLILCSLFFNLMT